jgi:predicted anti-sigma-YlaC factor YlaD
MSTCDYHEAQLSAWLDDELDRPGQLELLDHLVRCADCRRFHAEARALDALVAIVRRPAEADRPSPEVWQRIHRGSTNVADAGPTRRAIPAWALRAAAVMVLALGLGSLVWFGSRETAEKPAEAIVQLGEESGQMTDVRFVELTQEVLRADPRYRSAMFRVMQQVMRDTEDHEALVEYDDAPGGASDGAGESEARRMPV